MLPRRTNCHRSREFDEFIGLLVTVRSRYYSWSEALGINQLNRQCIVSCVFAHMMKLCVAVFLCVILFYGIIRCVTVVVCES